MKKAKTIRKANSPFFWVLRCFFTPVLYMLYHFKFEKNTSKEIKRPCFILANHQTVNDQFAVGLGFNFGINYVASDSIFRHGLLSKIMVKLTQPIPFSKGSSDFVAVKNMFTVIKDGGCVGMFPSGNRSFFGDECRIVDGIGKLAKKLNVPLVLVQVRGGFNTHARWKAKPSRGKMRAVVSRIVNPEELASLSSPEVDGIIQKELRFNEFEFNKNAKIEFRGKHKAEYLESVLFYCPECGSLKGLFSSGNEFYCRDCGARVRINTYGFFERIEKAEKIPETILEWSHIQLNFIKSLDFSIYTNKPVFSDSNVRFFKTERARSEKVLGIGSIELYADKLRVCGSDYPISEITMAVIGVRKMSIYANDGVFAVISPYRTNLLKYMICGYYLRNKALGITEEYYGY
ncbi:MAG: 1-acyl-sn-glycerol-3-phosphate acyltransferase [Treponema sp.]|nr:1-acyl-sn-glycerol-3-phosphate acyltransferase [Treponema sp.]